PPSAAGPWSPSRAHPSTQTRRWGTDCRRDGEDGGDSRRDFRLQAQEFKVEFRVQSSELRVVQSSQCWCPATAAAGVNGSVERTYGMWCCWSNCSTPGTSGHTSACGVYCTGCCW